MASRPEAIASRCLRALLAPLPTGAPIEESQDFRDFQSALERFLPSRLAESYPWWTGESLDAFRFAVARKRGPHEAEFIGLCLLITDQTWTPLHLRLRLAPCRDKIEWLDCKLGEAGKGKGGMARTPYGSSRETTRLHSLPDRVKSISWAYRIVPPA